MTKGTEDLIWLWLLLMVVIGSVTVILGAFKYVLWVWWG